MCRYEPTTPRLALATVAFAMTTMTMGLMVALPAWIEADAHDITKPVIAERKGDLIFVRARELSAGNQLDRSAEERVHVNPNHSGLPPRT